MKPQFDLRQVELLTKLVQEECARLDRKLGELDRSKKLHTELGDFDTVARIEARYKRFTELQAEAYELDEILYFSHYGRGSDKQLASSHTGSELVEALELNNLKS